MLKNVGLAGAYSGIVEDKLLVLGGANFPDKYPWEGGVKTWWSTLYSYDLHMDKWTVYDDSLQPISLWSFDMLAGRVIMYWRMRSYAM